MQRKREMIRRRIEQSKQKFEILEEQRKDEYNKKLMESQA